jgi:hypothetical protein
MASITVPGKVFLMGEYSVLQGGVALLAAMRPGYPFSYPAREEGAFDTTFRANLFEPHPESPLGRYVDEAEEKQIFISKVAGSMTSGFGTSTAELIAGVMADLGRLPETKRLWAWYRDTFPKASGADLAVQMDALRTKQSLFIFDHGDTRFLEPGGSGSEKSLASKIHLFQVESSQKLPTHEAMKQPIPQFDIAQCNAWVKRLADAFSVQQLEELKIFSEFAEYMHECGVETELARETRLKLSKHPGVVGVKGCGAGLHDVFLVAGDFGSDHSVYAEASNLRLKALGILEKHLW